MKHYSIKTRSLTIIAVISTILMLVMAGLNVWQDEKNRRDAEEASGTIWPGLGAYLHGGRGIGCRSRSWDGNRMRSRTEKQTSGNASDTMQNWRSGRWERPLLRLRTGWRP